MSDIRFNQWLHQSGTGGVSQVASGAVGVGTTNPLADFYVRGDAQITGILTAGHIAMGSSITFGDDDRAYFGNGTDLQIYHSGSDSFISDTGTGDLLVTTSQMRIKNAANNATMAVFTEGGKAQLWYNNSQKFETTNTGAIVTGILTATSFSGTASGNATITGNGDNRIITGGSGNALNGESTFTYNGTHIAKIDTDQTYAQMQLDGNSGGIVEFFENGTRKWEIYGTDPELAIYDRDKGSYHARFKSGGNLELTDGKLLIGTTTEGSVGADELTIATSGSTGITIRSGTSNDGNVFFSDTTSGTGEYAGYVQYEHANDALRFGTASNERLRIESSGATRLKNEYLRFQAANQNSGDFTQRVGLKWTQETDAEVAKIEVQRSAWGGAPSELVFHTRKSDNSVNEVFRLGDDGRIGIGNDLTNTYDATYHQLCIGNGANANNGMLFHVGSNAGTYIGFKDTTDNTVQGIISYTHSNDAMGFRTNGTEKLSIASGGNVTVTSGSLIAENSGAGSGTSQLQLQPYGIQGYINHTGSSHLYLRMGSSYAQRFIFRNNGDLELTDGNLMVASSHGIDFSAETNEGSSSQDTTLADYEEGTWTPTNSIGMTLTVNNTAHYIKVGKLVTIWFDVTLTGHPDSAQCAVIQSLPYVSKATNSYYGQSNSVWYSNTGDDKRDYDDDNTLIYVNNDSSTINIWNVTSGHVRVRSWADGRRFRGTVTYIAKN